MKNLKTWFIELTPQARAFVLLGLFGLVVIFGLMIATIRESNHARAVVLEQSKQLKTDRDKALADVVKIKKEIETIADERDRTQEEINVLQNQLKTLRTERDQALESARIARDNYLTSRRLTDRELGDLRTRLDALGTGPK